MKSAMLHRYLLLLCFASTMAAGPKVTVDSTVFNFGTVYEGKSDCISHVFQLKNTGDSLLRITSIKASCGCTSFIADSSIAPGATGRISAKLDLREVHGNEVYKYLMVHTNAPNMRVMELSFHGILKTFIETDPASIVLPAMDTKDTFKIVTLTTDKPDLVVRDAYFEINDPQVNWQSTLPIRFEFKAAGKMNNRSTYSVTLYYTAPGKKSLYGNFVLKTNHPDKPVLKIAGVLDPKK